VTREKVKKKIEKMPENVLQAELRCVQSGDMG